MIKHLQKIGNSRGIVLDKPILDLLGVGADGSFEVKMQEGGLFLKPVADHSLFMYKLLYYIYTEQSQWSR